MTAITVESVRKAFGDTTALDGLSLEIEEGELYGLLGPNGAGKTTTLAILTGQLRPDGGTVTVLDINPVENPVDVRQAVGMLPEKESPPSLMTPREYLRFCGTVRNLPDSDVDDGIEDWAEQLDFVGKLDSLSTDLSRGQQQKVMIAAAFLHEPAVVFIDEPLANLDPIVQERVKRSLREYRDAGNTVVISTHNVTVAAELCSRVGFIEAGTLVDEVHPASLDRDQTLLDLFFEHIDNEEGATAAGHAE